jgi:nucleotide-binding universal stress UspA family protein
MDLKRYLVPTDFSDAANRAFEQALALALALAGSDAGEILLLHRLPSPVPVFAPPSSLGAGGFQEMGRMLDEYTTGLRDEASQKLEELRKKAPKGISIEVAIDESLEPYEAILHKASEWKADLIVMGTHGRRGLDKLLMGSVASAVLHRTEHNVMLLRAESEIFALGADPGLILVPVDFSDYSHRALHLARLVATRFGASVHLMHVVELLHTPLKPGGLTSRFEEQPDLKDKYRTALKDMLGDTPGDVTVAEGTTVAGEILWWREKLGARLVVMGSRGEAGLKHLLVGSVTDQVARFCEVPVVVVR